MPKADATIKKMVFKENTDSGKIAIGMGRGRKNHSHAENKLLFFCSKKTTYAGGCGNPIRGKRAMPTLK
jgi:hypothetical protein